MKYHNKIMLTIMLLIAALGASACTVSIDGEQVFVDGRVVADESFTLPNSKDGNELNESLVVFGGSVHLLEDSKVSGDVIVFGGNADLAGEITGDLVIFGGHVTLSDGAVIRQDLVSFGTSFNRSPSVVVDGQVITNVPIPEINIPAIRFNPIVFPGNNFPMGYGLFSVLSYFLNTIAFTALAVLVVLFLPKQTENTAETVISRPIASGGLGCLTLFIVPIVAVAIMIFIITIPISFLAFFFLGIAIVFGGATVGLVVGRRLAEALDRDWAPIVETAVGTLIVSLVAGGLSFVGPLGALVWIAICSVGLGAVVITRFGTQGFVNGEVLEIAAVEPEPKPKPKAKPKTTKTKSSKKK